MTTPGTFGEVVQMFITIGMRIIPFMAVLAFLVFVLGVARFISAASDGKDTKDSKNLLIWGVIGLLVIVTIWGIVSFLSSEFGFGSGTPIIPQVHF